MTLTHWVDEPSAWTDAPQGWQPAGVGASVVSQTLALAQPATGLAVDAEAAAGGQAFALGFSEAALAIGANIETASVALTLFPSGGMVASETVLAADAQALSLLHSGAGFPLAVEFAAAGQPLTVGQPEAAAGGGMRLAVAAQTLNLESRNVTSFADGLFAAQAGEMAFAQFGWEAIQGIRVPAICQSMAMAASSAMVKLSASALVGAQGLTFTHDAGGTLTGIAAGAASQVLALAQFPSDIGQGANVPASVAVLTTGGAVCSLAIGCGQAAEPGLVVCGQPGALVWLVGQDDAFVQALVGPLALGQSQATVATVEIREWLRISSRIFTEARLASGVNTEIIRRCLVDARMT